MRSMQLAFTGLVLWLTNATGAAPASPLPQTAALTNVGDLSAQMVAGIDRWLRRETERVASGRTNLWQGDLSAEFKRSRREQLREMIGAVDERVPNPRLQFLGDGEGGAEIFRSTGPRGFVAYRVRWPVFEGVFGEGLLLEPLGDNEKPVAPIASALAIPDADQWPEMIAGLRAGVAPESEFARHLAESGWRVLVPVLIRRDDEFSGNPRL